MKKLIQVILFIAAATSIAQNNKISITIDDVPCSNCKTFEIAKEVNDKLIKILSDYNVPAIGFINEIKLYTNSVPDQDKINILKQWLRNNLEFGNHTFSHLYIDKSSIIEYEDDILKGEIIIKPLMESYDKQLKYFRHTQLRTGPNQQYKDQLDSILLIHQYITAPVTMDNDEYIYAYCYKKAKEQNDSVDMMLIADDYLVYMNEIFNYYEKLSIDFLSYNLNQILLLHANELNADYLDELLQILQNRKYTFISLDEALADRAYQLPEVYSKRGISWIDRWKLAKGLSITSQPEVSKMIQMKMEQFKLDPSM